MLLKIALLISMLIQIGAASIAVGLIRKTRFNISWILISASFVLMAVRRLYDFSSIFWQYQLFSQEDINIWLGILISVLMFTGTLFIRRIFNLQEQIDQLRKENESKVLSAFIEGEEKARKNLARDLHDGLGPILSTIKMSMSAVEMEDLNPRTRKIIERSGIATDESILSLKEISNDLSPHLLTNYGLTETIRTVANQRLCDSGTKLTYSSKIAGKRFSNKIEISIYRIISELLTNSIKHGSPKKITIKLREESGQIQLNYEDNGKGFDAKKTTKREDYSGMGLDNIQSRIKALDGFLHLSTAPGKGFSIDIHIPIK